MAPRLPTLNATQQAELDDIVGRISRVVLGRPDSGWPKDLPLFGDFLRMMLDVTGQLQTVKAADSGVRRLFVDPVHGSDDNDGLLGSTPLRNIQTAVLMFLPPYAPQTWALNDDRVIDVLHSAGMAAITEQVIIPVHAGMGALRILAEENVLANALVVNGAFGAVVGKEVNWTLDFTTAPLAAHTLGHGAILRLHNQSDAPTAYMAALNDLPVVDNLAGQVTVIACDPGLSSAFAIQNGTVVDLVAPQITWTLPANNDANTFAPAAACIINMGGPLFTQGFAFQSPVDASFFKGNVVLANVGPALDSFWGPQVVLGRYKTLAGPNGEQWSQVSDGAAVHAGGLLGPSSIQYFTNNSNVLMVFNVDANAPSTFSALTITHVRNGLLCGVNVAGSSLFFDDAFFSQAFVDVDATGTTSGSAAVDFTGGHTDFLALTSINAGNIPALAVGSHAGYPSTAVGFLDAGRVSGSAGNTDVGCRVEVMGTLHSYGGGTPTLAGLGGQVKVGTQLAQNWLGTNLTDATDLCRADGF